MVCPQSLVHSEQTQAIFKNKTQQTFGKLIKENHAGQATKTKQVKLMKSKMKHSARLDKKFLCSDLY